MSPVPVHPRTLLAALLAALLALAVAPAFAPLAAQTTAADSALIRRADHARILGQPTAKVWLIIVSDFQCPFCKRWHDSTFATLVREYVDTGKIRMAYINFPLPMHKNAVPAAEAAMCAAAQDRFWPMQDALFSAQLLWENEDNPAPMLDTLAAHAGVNVKEMRRCIAKGLMRATIDGDVDRARDAGAQSTPTFKIPGAPLIVGAEPVAVFRERLNAAVAQAAMAPASKP